MAKILLVEDDKSLREIYGVRLLAEGYDIVSAGDGEEALAMAIKERPDLIVSDVMMPKISGFDMLDILRSTTETKNIKVIMMTALSSDDQRARGEQLGADRYLVKSQVGIEDVVRTVHEVLGDAPVNNPEKQEFPPSSAPAPQPGTYQPANDAKPPLPQPTAPFSTPRPAGLGDRIIHPIDQNEGENKPDMATLMNRELQNTPPRPGVAPAGPSAPQPPAPVQPTVPPRPEEPPQQPPQPAPQAFEPQQGEPLEQQDPMPEAPVEPQLPQSPPQPPVAPNPFENDQPSVPPVVPTMPPPPPMPPADLNPDFMPQQQPQEEPQQALEPQQQPQEVPRGAVSFDPPADATSEPSDQQPPQAPPPPPQL